MLTSGLPVVYTPNINVLYLAHVALWHMLYFAHGAIPDRTDVGCKGTTFLLK